MSDTTCDKFYDPSNLKPYNTCQAGNNAESFYCANPRYGVNQDECNKGVIAGVLNYSNTTGQSDQKTMNDWCNANANLSDDAKKGCSAFVGFLYGSNK